MDIKKIIKERHEIIKTNPNAEERVLRRLTFEIDNDIKVWQVAEIRRLKLVYERNAINCAYNKQKYKKRNIKLPTSQKKLET